MDLRSAQSLARQLIERHGLVGWSFRFDHARRRFGACRIRNKLITLSRPLTLLNPIEQVRDTILHEIAHALTPGDGHGAKWKTVCLSIGAKPVRCFVSSEVVTPTRRPARYSIGCRTCGWWSDRRRLTARQLVCRTCRQAIVYVDKASGRHFRILIEKRRRLIQPVDAAGDKREAGLVF